MAARRSVSIRVLGQEYRIRTDADPGELRRVASLVDETMGRLRERTGAVDSLDLAMMTAVNLARDLLHERSTRKTGAGATARIRHLVERVERSLKAESPANT